ncbi:B2 protein-like [Diabrotica undecimpunctata]|uniref:B2 protein-like n=1 Tax=Diabrotica undecimpunctata TaxID=50387 RepID=UPI003B63C520
MKLAYLLFIALVCLTAAASQTEHQKVGRMIEACQKELGSTVNEIKNINLGIINPDTGKQVLCVHRKLETLNQNGDVIPDKFKQHIEAITDDVNHRKKFQDRCGKTQGGNPEVKAINFDKCIQSVIAEIHV